MKIKRVYIASAIVLILASVFSNGYFNPDEHFQILEFAGLKLNLNVAANLPWEYHYEMRSVIQPSIVVLLFRLFNLTGINNPFIVAFVLRLMSAAMTFLVMHLMYKAYIGEIKNPVLKRWYLLLSFLLWTLVFIGVRFSSENWSGIFFLLAFSLMHVKRSHRKIFFLFIGLLLGAAFLFRYQTGFLIAGFIAWYWIIKKNKMVCSLMMLGIFSMTAAGILIDRWFYGHWTITAWNYFNENIIYDKVSGFGTMPWWYYFKILSTNAFPLFGIPFLLSFIVVFVFRRRDVLTFTLLPFLLIHFFIGHKEIRFLFPVIGFLPVVIIKALEVLQEKINPAFTDQKAMRIAVVLFWSFNIAALLIVTFKPANPQINLFHKLYSNYHEPATLYFIDDNPYHRALDVYFYKRSNLTIRQIKSVSEIVHDSSSKQLFVTQKRNLADGITQTKKLIYSTFPEWIRKFNFNHWLERSDCWYVYEIDH
jgi:phosphatidylinositol glycan class B